VVGEGVGGAEGRDGGGESEFLPAEGAAVAGVEVGDGVGEVEGGKGGGEGGADEGREAAQGGGRGAGL